VILCEPGDQIYSERKGHEGHKPVCQQAGSYKEHDAGSEVELPKRKSQSNLKIKKEPILSGSCYLVLSSYLSN